MMPSREDHDLRLSVSDLAGVDTAGGGEAAAPLGQRLRLGQRVHDLYRAAAAREHPGYRKEVFVRWTGIFREQRVLVEGRIDGLFLDGDTRVVEEIKSVLWPEGDEAPEAQLPLAGADEDDDPRLEAYRWQCALYCHFLALAEPGAPITGRLTRVDVRTLEARSEGVPYDPEACAAFLEARLAARLGEAAEARRLAAVRAALAGEVSFPFAAERPFQADLRENVAGAAETGLGLVVSAPTGIGKTAAAAVPLLRSALATDRRLMIVTAKVSQQGMYLDLLERLLPAGREVLVSQLEARERSCPREEMLCSVHACPLLREAARPEALAKVRTALAPGGVVRAEGLRALAAVHRLCPFEVGLEAAGIADVVVGDLNYAFHPQAALERFFAPGGRRRLLLVDEAHNLPARAQDFLSPALLRSRVRMLAEGCLHGAHPVFSRILPFLLNVEALLVDLAAEAARQPDGPRAVTEVTVDRERLALLCGDAEDWLLDYLAWSKSGLRRPPAFVPRREAGGGRRVVDPFLSFCYDLLHVGRAAEERGDHMTALLRRTADDVELKIFCKDPARYLAACHRRFDAVVAMSATLEPLGFFADVLGVSRLRNHASCAFPSPFDPAHRCLVVDASVSTRYARRMGELPAACRTMAALAALRPGNYLAFFPSYEVLGVAAGLLRALAPGLQVVAQVPGTGADPLLGDLAAAAGRRGAGPDPGSLIAAVVIGGSLAEGVDLAGELCTGAFIFGPGLPAVTEERALMHDYYQQEYGSGFEYAYLYPGLARVVQAAGRVIRGPEERGVIVLFDERFAEPRYRELLPGYWQEELVITSDPVPVVSAFWGGAGASGPSGSGAGGSAGGGAAAAAPRKSQRSSSSSS